MLSLQLPALFATFQIPLIYLNNIVTLAIPPEHQVLRVGLGLPILAILVAQSLYRERSGSWADEYAINCAIITLAFHWVDWVLLAVPDKEKWRKIQYKRDEKREKANGTVNGRANGVAKEREETEAYPVTFLSRLWWAARLATTHRYTGWTSQAKNVRMEVDASYPRILFILRKSLRLFLFYLAKDIVVSYSASTPYGRWLDNKDAGAVFRLTAAPFWTRFQCIWIHILITYANLELYNVAYGVLSVAIGLANPRDCPSIFGDLKELTSVRKLWGNVWHQQFRRAASDPAIFIARDVLRLRKGSFGSKYLQLFIAFGLSGIMHAGASMLIHRSSKDDAAIAFFMGQAVIIMIEDHVIDLGKSLGFTNTLFWRLIGFCWVFFVMGWTLQVWSGEVIDHGMWTHSRERDWLGIGPAA